jgi:GNAT superfamily N-acetyltransferase
LNYIVSVFHRILDFKTGLNVDSDPFFIRYADRPPFTLYMSDLVNLSSSTQMIFRKATIGDIREMQRIRHAVKENRLSDPGLVTDQDCEEFITRRGQGWVAEEDNSVKGFAILDLVDKNIWALFVDPSFERKGIGRKLQELMLNWYFSSHSDTIWLGTAPHTRAAGFYRRSGWRETGLRTNGEIRFEMSFQSWLLGKGEK